MDRMKQRRKESVWCANYESGGGTCSGEGPRTNRVHSRWIEPKRFGDRERGEERDRENETWNEGDENGMFACGMSVPKLCSAISTKRIAQGR